MKVGIVFLFFLCRNREKREEIFLVMSYRWFSFGFKKILVRIL